MNSNTIKIAPGKKKLTYTALGSLAFVLIGLWLLINQPKIGNPVFDNVFFKYGVSIAAIAFFGFTLFFAIKKLATKLPSLVIDDDGVLDNASAVNVGQVLWLDIADAEVVTIFKQQFLLIMVNNPAVYINRQTNVFKRKALQYNVNNYGTPVAIPATAVNCDIFELKNTIMERLEAFKSNVDG